MPGFGCITTGTSRTCVQRVGTNGPCSTTEYCGNLGDVCSNGACRTGGLSNFGCSTNDNCQGFHQCNSTIAACDVPPDVPESCANYSSCRTGYCDQVTQTCTDKKANGDNCAPAQAGNECQSGYCDTTLATPKCGPRPICT
jgi:hypothetical protein